MSVSDLKDNMIGNYIILDSIGYGSFSNVHHAIDKTNNVNYAIKIINLSETEDKDKIIEKTQKEISILHFAEHPHVVQLYDVIKTDSDWYLILELAPHGSLLNYIHNSCNYDYLSVSSIFRQIIFTLDYIHAKGICHRDIKPENILLFDGNMIKFADFGLSHIKTYIDSYFCGSLAYAAPEVLYGNPYDGKLADIWSCGVVLYYMLFGVLPFVDESYSCLKGKIQRGLCEIPTLEHGLTDLLKGILCVEPSERYTLERIKSHPFLRAGLPEEYCIPTPLSHICFDNPFCVESLTEDEVLMIKEMGNTIIFEEMNWEGYNESKGFISRFELKWEFQTILTIGDETTYEVMEIAQNLANVFDIQWCHPDEFTLFCRKDLLSFYISYEPRSITILHDSDQDTVYHFIEQFKAEF